MRYSSVSTGALFKKEKIEALREKSNLKPTVKPSNTKPTTVPSLSAWKC